MVDHKSKHHNPFWRSHNFSSALFSNEGALIVQFNSPHRLDLESRPLLRCRSKCEPVCGQTPSGFHLLSPWSDATVNHSLLRGLAAILPPSSDSSLFLSPFSSRAAKARGGIDWICVAIFASCVSTSEDDYQCKTCPAQRRRRFDFISAL